MDVSEIGEFGLIERLASILGREAPADLIVGIGDDAAVWRAGDQYVIATTDTLVEGVHFPAAAASWADVGWKALAVNVSDIGAMGGEPLFALVTLALPAETAVDDIDALYRGLSECAAEYGIAIAGGDIVSAPQVAVTVALLGRAQVSGGEPLLLLRGGAKPGDAIAVSGTLGASAAGLRRLREGAQESDRLVRAHMRPSPPLSLGQEAARGGLLCGIDVSDGLLQDIGHICEKSGLGALVRADSVPVSPDLTSAYPDDALRLACTGGEDYELVLVGDRGRIERAGAVSGVSVAIIGEMTDDPKKRVRLVDGGGNEIDFGASGWDHLRGTASERRA
jgi:thiamine-monophosphate kinase